MQKNERNKLSYDGSLTERIKVLRKINVATVNRKPEGQQELGLSPEFTDHCRPKLLYNLSVQCYLSSV